MDGDNWKYGEPPELAEVRKHMQARTNLLVMLPHYPVPLEGMISEISPSGDFVAFGNIRAWVARAELRILDVLPRRPAQHA